jgi:hypothetical protein
VVLKTDVIPLQALLLFYSPFCIAGKREGQQRRKFINGELLFLRFMFKTLQPVSFLILYLFGPRERTARSQARMDFEK